MIQPTSFPSSQDYQEREVAIITLLSLLHPRTIQSKAILYSLPRSSRHEKRMISKARKRERGRRRNKEGREREGKEKNEWKERGNQ